MLGAIILLVLYVVFLGQVQVDDITEGFTEAGLPEAAAGDLANLRVGYGLTLEVWGTELGAPLIVAILVALTVLSAAIASRRMRSIIR